MDENSTDPQTRLAALSLNNLAAMRIMIDALHAIALLEGTCPLAAEIAMGALRSTKQQVAPLTVVVS